MGLLILVFLVVGIVCFLISRGIYNKLVRVGSKYAIAISIASFIVSAALILGALLIVFIYNFSLQR